MNEPGRQVLLEAAVALSAGLHAQFDRDFITGQFPTLRANLDSVEYMLRQLSLSEKAVNFRNLDQVAVLLQDFKSERLIFAGSRFGPPLVAIAALASAGAKVGLVYWEIREDFQRILENCRVRSVNLRKLTNRFSLFRQLRLMHTDGYVIWMMCDAPGKSRGGYRFLGYDVNCANLIEVYARIHRCTVVPCHCRLESSTEASLYCSAPLRDCENLTQRLLADLETQIYQDHVNYIWSGTSIIFSDPRALPNGLRYLPEFLEWRDRADRTKMPVQSRRVMA